MIHKKNIAGIVLFYGLFTLLINLLPLAPAAQTARQKISINDGWRFKKGDPADGKGLLYDVRPEVTDRNDNIVADTKPTESVAVASSGNVLKNWILPTAND